MPPRDPNYARPAYPAPRERSGLGSTLFYGGLGLIAMAAGAVAFALLALPADFVRDRAIAAVKERTGRDLVIAGPSSFTIYPSLGISLADVSLSGAPGFEGAKPLVSMKSLDVSVAFWPLIQREVRVSSLVLREPVFHLEVDGSGRRSWDFAAADGRRNRTRLAQADAPVTDASPAASGESAAARQHLSDVKLEDVRVENGALTYHDQRTGSTSEISSINTKMALAALTEPLSAEGSLAYKGKTVSFNGALTSLAEVLEERPAKLNMTLGTDVLDATFEGTAKLETLSTEGILSAKSSSARALFAWLGSELPPSDGFGAVTAKGLWRASPDRYAFSTAEIVLDQTTARGDISLDTRGARPLVDANLTLTELDLNTYGSKGARRAAPSAAPEKAGKAKSIEDLLEQAPAAPGPRVQGFTKREGWDEDAYNLAPLGALDANAKLSIGKLTVGTYHLDQSDLNVALKNRVMITTLNQVRLYEGTGTGTVTLDGTTEAEANLGATLTLENISAQPLFKDAAEIDNVTGKGRLTLALTGQGANERQIVETLAGRISFAFADGAILGVNVPEMMRNLGKGNLGGLNTAPTDKTDFSEMTSTWTVRAGIAENQDLKLVSPLLRVGGSGKVELPAREVDYLLKPKLVASLAGQGGAQDLSGIEVPVRVHGPWAKPKYTPDFAAVLKDPKAAETIKDIGKQFKGKKADEIVNDLMSKDESGKSKGKKLLEQFLNKQ
jgi:AsmA protein